MKRIPCVAIIIAIICSLSAPAFADERVWNDNAADDLWATDANWTAASHPIAGDTAKFDIAGSTISLGAGAAATSLYFDTGAGETYIIGSVAGQTLTLNADGAITVHDNAVTTQTIAANVVLLGGYGFDSKATNAAGLLSVTGNITGPGAAATLTLKGANTGNNTISGAIGNGAAALAVTKAEAGKWILSGANAYTGGTTVNAGTLALTVNNFTSNVNYTGAGTLDLANGLTITGALTTSADNQGILTLSGDGAQRVTGAVGTSSILDLATITKSGTGTATFDSAVFANALNITAAGTVMLDTASTIAASTITAAGTLDLDANLTGAVALNAANATLDVADGANLVGAVTANAANQGVVTYNGGSTLGGALGVVNANELADVNINGGIVNTGFNIAATTIDVAAGGTLRLTGNIATEGTLALANATTAVLDLQGNTLTHVGALTFLANSALNLAVAGNTSFGNAQVTGTITLPATVVINVNVTGYVINGTSITVLNGSAGGAVPGGNPVTSNSAVLTCTATTDADKRDLILIVSRATNGYPARASSANARAAGTQLEAAGNAGATGDMAIVLNTLDGLSAAQISAALDTVLPEVNAGVIDTSTASLNNFVGASLDRIHTVLAPAAGAGSPAKKGVSSGDESKLNGVWAKGYGSYLNQGTRKDTQGYDAWNAGTAIGVDRLFTDNITFGISGGLAYGNVDSDVNSGNTVISSVQTTIYGGYQDDNYPYFIDVAGMVAWNWYNGYREIHIGNTIGRTANADYDGQQYGAYIGGGYTFRNICKDLEGLEVTPLLSLQYSHLRTGSYTETEAWALNLSVASQNYDLLQSGLGASIAYPMKVKWGILTPEAHGKWLYDFIGDAMVVTSTFTGGGGSFSSNGADPAQNSFNVGGKLSLDMKNDISIIGVCDTEMKDEFFGIYGSVTLRYNF